MSRAPLPIEINGRWLSKPTTGTGRYSTEVTKALMASGHPVVLWVPKDAIVPDWARQARVRRIRSSGQWFEQVALPLRTRGRVLLSMGGPAPAFKRRQVAVLHDATPFRLPQTYSRAFATWYRWLYRAIALSGARIATVSEFSARELHSVLGPRAGSPVLAQPAATLASSARRPQGRLPDRFFLTVGTLAEHKNLVPVVTALASAGIPVVTVGESGDPQVFASPDMPRDDIVVRLGRVVDEELLWLYQNTEALLFPSLYEGFGLPALEAQAAGAPVLASNAGPLPEVLADSAMLIDPLDAEAFVDAARTLLAAPERRRDLIDRGRRNTQRFSWSRAAGALAEAVRATERRGTRPR